MNYERERYMRLQDAEHDMILMRDHQRHVSWGKGGPPTSEPKPASLLPADPPFKRHGKQVLAHGRHFTDSATEEGAQWVCSLLNRRWRIDPAFVSYAESLK